eukprot:Transcript_20257.p1 GENE.Transcript_20257~~Transcript_20257.p1  ORF type:complete len:263 (-),score=101.13 Transcript_20257:83-796(-)
MAASVDELQHKMHEALDFDQKKAQLNDAKLRAVSQKVEYSEFEKMVAGAHLKPVKPCSQQSGATSDEFSGFVMPTYKPVAVTPAAALAATEQFTAPKTSNDFLRAWRRQCKTPEAKYRYLHTFDADTLPLIFRSEMDPSILDGVAEALRTCALPAEGCEDGEGGGELREAEWVELLLRYLCRINRFSLTLDLAGADTKQTLAACFDSLTRTAPAEGGGSGGRLDAAALSGVREAYAL